MRQLTRIERVARALHKSDGNAWLGQWKGFTGGDWPKWSKAGHDQQQRCLRRAKVALSTM